MIFFLLCIHMWTKPIEIGTPLSPQAVIKETRRQVYRYFLDCFCDLFQTLFPLYRMYKKRDSNRLIDSWRSIFLSYNRRYWPIRIGSGPWYQSWWTKWIGNDSRIKNRTLKRYMVFSWKSSKLSNEVYS